MQRTLVLVRFLTLGRIFREFCELAREEPSDENLGLWAEALDVNPIRVGQLLGPSLLTELFDDDLSLENAVSELVDKTVMKFFNVSEALRKRIAAFPVPLEGIRRFRSRRTRGS